MTPIALTSLGLLALAAASPKVELRPLKSLTNLGVGQCSVDVDLKLTIEDRGVEDYYCPRVEWEWEDGAGCGEEAGCVPLGSARPEDHRQTWTRSWGARAAGTHVVKVRLYKGDRVVRIVETQVRVVGFDGMSAQQRRDAGCP